MKNKMFSMVVILFMVIMVSIVNALVTAPTPDRYLKVISPNGGENFETGKPLVIKYDAVGGMVRVRIDFIGKNVPTQFKIIENAPTGKNQQISWTPQHNVPAGDYKIEISGQYETVIHDPFPKGDWINSLNYFDDSDKTFNLKKSKDAPKLTCSDTDGGRVVDIAGIVKYSDELGKPGTFNDICDTNGIKNLKEYYCNADGTYGMVLLQCDDRCVQGKCVKLTLPPGPKSPTCKKLCKL